MGPEESTDDTVLQRKKRMAQVEKNTCQLFIQTDHLFFKYYKSREAVIAQVRAVKVQDTIPVHAIYFFFVCNVQVLNR